jgi:hypothetical protein
MSLFGSSHLYDLGSKHVDEQTQKTLLDSQETLMASKLERLKKKMGGAEAVAYNYFGEQCLLYTYLPSAKSGKTQALAWSLEHVLEEQEGQIRIPLSVNQIEVFGNSKTPNTGKDPNCILNLNQFVTKNYFTRHQHSFFYSDEEITDQTFYVSSDFPSMVVGTNYGRIFIVQLF